MNAATDAFSQPEWFWDLLDAEPDASGFFVKLGGSRWKLINDIPRAPESVSEMQEQTSETFGYKWRQRGSFEAMADSFTPQWLREKYGPFSDLTFLEEHGEAPVVLDAGCGAGLSGFAFFGERMSHLRYLGADVSDSVDTAATRSVERNLSAGFVQCDLNNLPLPDDSVDVIFSEGVLHHTDNTRNALERLVAHLKPDGRILFYVYRAKGPIREFTDDFIRHQLRGLDPEQAWDALLPVTSLGIELGKLDVDINLDEPIDILNIPAGKINLQRFFYWHVLKAFYRPEMSFDEMQHINFDWYRPENARRHTPEEVRHWCDSFHLTIKHQCIEEAGITIVARKTRD